MAAGALVRTPADLAVAITGVAGPAPDEDDSPVGLVCIAVAQTGQRSEAIERRYDKAARERIQSWAIGDALAALLNAAETLPRAEDTSGTGGSVES